MKRNQSAAVIALFTLLILIGCKKTTYKNPATVTDYFNSLQVGKYAIYQLDSLTFYYYGQLDTVTHYHAKDSVEEALIDNEGRPGWRVVRYLSDPDETLPWTPSGTFWVTPTRQHLEVVEDNLRFIKLAFPVDDGVSWSGNSFLPYAPFKDFFDFSDDSHLNLQLWNFTYQDVNKPATIGSNTYDSTVTVMQMNDSINVPILDPNSFASRTYWSETYAKNVGLVYRHTAIWEYQPPTPNGSQTGYKIGYEVTLTLLSHN